MLSSDRFEPRSLRDHAAREPVPSVGAGEPWDAQSAEALTRLYETDEGKLFQPHAGERAGRAGPQEASPAAPEAGAGDRTWLEARLCELGARMQDSLSRLNPEKSLNTLSGRLEALEQRFGTALGRVAQRADLEGLRAIEAHVLELAAQLEASRERLEQIGAVEDQVRRLARRLDEGDGRRLGTLGKLLRDYIAEWRESEQRTASALHNLEEAIARLGDSVDAMEASRPAPELSLPTLAGPESERAHLASKPFSQAHDEGDRAPKSYHARLEANDYAPKPVPDLQLPERESAPPAAAEKGLQPLPTAAIEWSASPAGGDHSRPPDWPPRGFRITAVRAKLRRTLVSTAETANAREDRPTTAGDDPPRPAARRTRFGLLLIAGVAFLAGGVYLLFQTIVAPPTASPVRIKPSAQSLGVKPIWRAPPEQAIGDNAASARPAQPEGQQQLSLAAPVSLA